MNHNEIKVEKANQGYKVDYRHFNIHMTAEVYTEGSQFYVDDMGVYAVEPGKDVSYGIDITISLDHVIESFDRILLARFQEWLELEGTSAVYDHLEVR